MKEYIINLRSKIIILNIRQFCFKKKLLCNEQKVIAGAECVINNNNANFCKLIYLIIISIVIFIFFKNNHHNIYGLSYDEKMKDYNNKNFSIIQRLQCPNCGFFSFYLVHLGCIYKLLSAGFIPIVDLKSFPNVYNSGNISITNPWELFFYQPYNYTLDEVEKYAKNVKYFHCVAEKDRPNERNIYYNEDLISFWHNFAKKFVPVKNEIINEAKNNIKQLFGNSKNILGVKIRGTDYLSLKLKYHSIQPKVEQVISDTKYMDKIYKYDFIFFSTEDEKIKKIFESQFGKKLKLLNPNIYIEYNETDKYPINSHKKIYGNLGYTKNYLLNIIILANCLDIITSRSNVAAGIFILIMIFHLSKI